MQDTSNADSPVLAGHASGRGATAAPADVAGTLAGFLEISGASEGTCPDPLAPRFERHDDLCDAATIIVSAEGLTVDVERGPGIRLTGILATGSVDDFMP